MPGGDEPRPPDEVLAFYARGREDERLSLEKGKLERERTEELLRRFLPAPPGIVLDVGGGTGQSEPSLLGASSHLLGIARKPAAASR
jgi:hypothetical protein